MVVLSALPFAGNPLSPDVMARTIDLADRVCGDHRVLMQGEAHPSDGPLDGVLATMADLTPRYRIGAWKVYCHAGGPGWYLDDHDPDAAQVGERVPRAGQRARATGRRRAQGLLRRQPLRQPGRRRPGRRGPSRRCRSSSTTRASRPSTARAPYDGASSARSASASTG